MTDPPEGVPTPFVWVRWDRVRDNIARMQVRANELGADVWPHFKSHQLLQVLDEQLRVGGRGVTCANLAQASVAEGHGSVRLLAYPVQLINGQADAIADMNKPDVLWTVTSTQAASALRRAIQVDRPSVVLELDVGCRRTGIAPSEVVGLARVCRDQGLAVVGLLTYPGHAYGLGCAEDAAQHEVGVLQKAAEDLDRAGFTLQHVTAGSTPTMRWYLPGGPINVVRPGSYVFGDRRLVALETMRPDQVALSVVGTVIDRDGDHWVIDVGARDLGRDRPDWLAGFGAISGHVNQTIDRIYDHHAVIDSEGSGSPAVGERVEVIPNNANGVIDLQAVVWTDKDPSGSALPLSVEAR